jgi:hypothetical protein
MTIGAMRLVVLVYKDSRACRVQEAAVEDSKASRVNRDYRVQILDHKDSRVFRVLVAEFRVSKDYRV